MSVREHHYLVLLPPLVLLAMRREPVWLWLPAYLVCALPGLFPLYDVHGLGYNEDPQRYWLPAVSTLHHAIKPLAPLWLLGGLLLRQFTLARARMNSQNSRNSNRFDTNSMEANPMNANSVDADSVDTDTVKYDPNNRNNRWRSRRVSPLLLVTLSLVAACPIGLWARGAIVAQRRVTRRLTLPDTIFALQHTPLTCGPAALATVCRYYGIPATEEEIARLAGTDLHGTSMLGLQRAALAKGLSAEGQERRLVELASLPRPCILYFHRGHFAVLTGIQNDRYYVADPSLGQRVWTRAQLNYLWRGEVLVVGPGK